MSKNIKTTAKPGNISTLPDFSDMVEEKPVRMDRDTYPSTATWFNEERLNKICKALNAKANKEAFIYWTDPEAPEKVKMTYSLDMYRVEWHLRAEPDCELNLIIEPCDEDHVYVSGIGLIPKYRNTSMMCYDFHHKIVPYEDVLNEDRSREFGLQHFIEHLTHLELEAFWYDERVIARANRYKVNMPPLPSNMIHMDENFTVGEGLARLMYKLGNRVDGMVAKKGIRPKNIALSESWVGFDTIINCTTEDRSKFEIVLYDNSDKDNWSTAVSCRILPDHGYESDCSISYDEIPLISFEDFDDYINSTNFMKDVATAVSYN